MLHIWGLMVSTDDKAPSGKSSGQGFDSPNLHHHRQNTDTLHRVGANVRLARYYLAYDFIDCRDSKCSVVHP